MTGKSSPFAAILPLTALSLILFACTSDRDFMASFDSGSGGGDTPGPAASFQALGGFAPGEPSWAHGVSGDGSVVVGYAYYSDGTFEAAQWTAASGWVALGARTFWANAASYDGSYAVGWGSGAVDDGQLHGFRWSATDGLGWLSIYNANDVSEDGSVIVCCALRWKNGVVTPLPTLGACCTQAYGVSGDGQVVVGSARIAAYAAPRAFRWTEAGGIQDLGIDGVATTASSDGWVIAGRLQISSWESRAFRWTPARGVEDLKTLGGTSATPWDMSADGSVIVGNSGINTSSVQRAFRWTTKKQMQDLRRELLDLGVKEVEGWVLQSAKGVSADGTVIVGYGFGPSKVTEAFRAVLPLP